MLRVLPAIWLRKGIDWDSPPKRRRQDKIFPGSQSDSVAVFHRPGHVSTPKKTPSSKLVWRVVQRAELQVGPVNPTLQDPMPGSYGLVALRVTNPGSYSSQASHWLSRGQLEMASLHESVSFQIVPPSGYPFPTRILDHIYTRDSTSC